MTRRPKLELGEIALRVNELGIMVDFYRDIVGLDLMRLQETFAFFRIADGYAGHTQVLALFDRSANQANYSAPQHSFTSVDHLAFSIANDDFESENQRLLELGIDVSYAFHDWVQWRSLYFQDPELNTVEFVGFDPSS